MRSGDWKPVASVAGDRTATVASAIGVGRLFLRDICCARPRAARCPRQSIGAIAPELDYTCDCASSLGPLPHEACIGAGFMRARPQSTGATARGKGLRWNSSTAVGRSRERDLNPSRLDLLGRGQVEHRGEALVPK